MNELIICASLLGSESLWLWGRNTDGELDAPKDLLPIVEISGTGPHIVALQTDGSIASWGRNNFGQTDVPQIGLPCVDVDAGDQHSIALDADGVVHCWGSNVHGQCDVPEDLGRAIQVATGSNHSLALLEDGTVRAWGYNPYGGTSVPVNLQNVVSIDGGAHHSVALLSSGALVAWGGIDGEPNAPSGLDFIEAKASEYNTIALTSSGDVFVWGRNLFGQASVPSLLEPAIRIGIGDHFAMAQTANGEIMCWGNTSWNECDIPSGAEAATALGASSLHGAAWIQADLRIDDCNEDGITDINQIFDGILFDTDGNGIADQCEQGVCCFNAECIVALASSCESIGGTYLGNEITCDQLECDGVPEPCPADINNDGDVGFTDILLVVNSWGPC